MVLLTYLGVQRRPLPERPARSAGSTLLARAAAPRRPVVSIPGGRDLESAACWERR
jgi:hypothetical protein